MFSLQKVHISSDLLKILALLSMTADHLVKAIDFEYTKIISNSFGRLAFPIFGFLIALNLNRASNVYGKYIFRLFVTGVITIILDYIFIERVQFNIMFSFLLSVVFLYSFEKINEENLSVIERTIMITFFLLACIQMSIVVEYSIVGFLYVIFFYFFLKNENELNLILLIFVSSFLNPETLAIVSTLCVVLFLILLRKNLLQTKRRILRKWWLFYGYYPLHKFLINIIF